MAVDDGDGGFTTLQKAALGGVSLLVVALFAFMVLNTEGEKDHPPVETAELPVDERPTTTAPTTAPSTAPAVNVYDPIDLEAFCRGGAPVYDFEIEFSARLEGDDWEAVRAWVRDGRQQYFTDLGVMATGAPPISAEDIANYATASQELFDLIEVSASEEAVVAQIDMPDWVRRNLRVEEVYQLVAFHCF